MNNISTLLGSILTIVLLSSTSLSAQVPDIPSGPNGLLYSCVLGAEEGNLDTDCFGLLLNSTGDFSRFIRARRTLRNRITRRRFFRGRALRVGNIERARKIRIDITQLRDVLVGVSDCSRYEDAQCNGGGGNFTTPNPGGENNNQNVAEACDALGDSDNSDRVANRIVNGAVCTRGDSPIVPILNEGFPHCTGSVIASNVVLTAAHCVNGFRCSNLSVTTGSGLARSSISCVSHPDYNQATEAEDNDVALIFLNGDLDTDIITLYTTKDIAVGETVTFAGYGRNENDDDNLRATFNVLTEVNEGSLIIEYTQGDTNRGNSCNGDSGGPLAILRDNEWVLIGAVSNGDATNCALPGAESNDVSRWANLTSDSNVSFIRNNTSMIID